MSGFMRRSLLGPLSALLLCLDAQAANAMSMILIEKTVVMAGMVMGDECDRLKAIAARTSITTVILAESNGGDAPTGYCVGEFIRTNGINTIVYGHCISSCSRMWLGGVKRTLEGTNARIGLHGHYSQGALMPESPARLKDWIPRFAPKVDKELMEQWVNLPFSRQVMFFYNERASICDNRDCKPIPGRNLFNAGLAD
jgi:hypothetical protein